MFKNISPGFSCKQNFFAKVINNESLMLQHDQHFSRERLNGF